MTGDAQRTHWVGCWSAHGHAACAERVVARLTAERDAAEGRLVRSGWCFSDGRWEHEEAFGLGYMIQVRHGSTRHGFRPYARCWVFADDGSEHTVTDYEAETVLAAMELAEAWLSARGAQAP